MFNHILDILFPVQKPVDKSKLCTPLYIGFDVKETTFKFMESLQLPDGCYWYVKDEIVRLKSLHHTPIQIFNLIQKQTSQQTVDIEIHPQGWFHTEYEIHVGFDITIVMED